jgi:UPF0271 protein
MGRQPWRNPWDALESLARQVDFLVSSGAVYLKPHGALYNQATEPGPAAEVLTRLLERFRLPLLGLSGTEHEKIAAAVGVRFVREGFADRRLLPDGRLMPRSQPGSVLHDPRSVVDNALSLAQQVDSICVHGDTPGCVALARTVRSELEAAGWRVEPWV